MHKEAHKCSSYPEGDSLNSPYRGGQHQKHINEVHPSKAEHQTFQSECGQGKVADPGHLHPSD